MSNMTRFIVLPFAALVLYGYLQPPVVKDTIIFSICSTLTTIVCVNIVYHRYLSHQAFAIDQSSFLFCGLLLITCSSGLTSGKKWSSLHKIHHRFCDDTDLDPQTIRRGWFYAHLGHLILKPSAKLQTMIDSQSHDYSLLVDFQDKWLTSLYILTGLVLPALVCGRLWHDYYGGLIFAGLLKTMVCQHANLIVSSLGHLVGYRNFNDEVSSRDNLLVNLISLGEGNLNFHHEFPVDYRNSPSFFSFDPPKWCLNIFYNLGLINNLKVSSNESINISLVQQQQKLLDNKRSKLNWGIPIDKLPIFTLNQFKRMSQSTHDRYLVIVSGIIHDVTPFASSHPGGLSIIQASHGKDATMAFEGGVYQHSNAARNLLANMRIGLLAGSEDIYWKQQRKENKLRPLDNDSEGKRIVRRQVSMGGTAEAA